MRYSFFKLTSIINFEKFAKKPLKKKNLIFVYLHYCNLTVNLEKLNDALIYIENCLQNENESFFWNLFCLLFHYHALSQVIF